MALAPRMERRLSRESSLQKKALENLRRAEQYVPALTDFMNDNFFGTLNDDKKPYYNLTGTCKLMDEDEDLDCSTRSNSSKLTHKWLEEARRVVASSGLLGLTLHMALLVRLVSLQRNQGGFRCHHQLNVETLSPGQLEDPHAPHARGIPIPIFRSFKTQAPLQDTQLLSPPKNLIDSAHRRSRSSSTCSFPENESLSLPRNLVESAQRRSISKSTCSLEKIAPRSNANGWPKEEDGTSEISLNEFLKEKRTKIEMILNGEIESKAKIVLSGHSNSLSTSSMVAAICYAWLLENRARKSKGKGDENGCIIVPVMSVRTQKGKNVEVNTGGSGESNDGWPVKHPCSWARYSQNKWRGNSHRCLLLQLAGILLDTENLNAYAKLSMGRDTEAVQLLLVGSAPNYRNTLYDQLMQDQRDNSFFEALRHNYGKPPKDDENNNDARNAKLNKNIPKSAKSNAVPVKAPPVAPEASRGKNKLFLANGLVSD
ncbi:hypothetical protein DITRI_Ditri03aG0093900 [Diplodiscus trichospermus]